MRMRVTSIIACVAVVAVAACSGSESPRQGENPASEVSPQAVERWEPLPKSRGRTVHVDMASLTRRADTVRMRARMLQGGDTVTGEIEIACATQRSRRIDDDQPWQPIKVGMPRMIADSLCIDNPRR